MKKVASFEVAQFYAKAKNQNLKRKMKPFFIITFYPATKKSFKGFPN